MTTAPDTIVTQTAHTLRVLDIQEAQERLNRTLTGQENLDATWDQIREANALIEEAITVEWEVYWGPRSEWCMTFND